MPIKHLVAIPTYDPEYFQNRDKRRDRSKKTDKEKGKKGGGQPSKGRLNLSFSQVKKKGLCYCCGKQHALTDCPNKNTTPKDQWYINKLQQSKAVNAYNEIKQEIKDVLVPARSQAPTQAPSSSASVGTVTNPNTSGWEFFAFVGVGVDLIGGITLDRADPLIALARRPST